MAEESPKKKLPTGIKLIIGIVGAVFALGILISIVMSALGTYFAARGDKLVEKGIEKMIEQQVNKENQDVDVKVDLTKEGLTMRDEKSGTVYSIKSGQELPADFPKDIPLPKNSEIQSSMIMGPMQILTLETKDDPDELHAFYQKTLKDQGWESVMDMKTPDGATQVFKKDERQVTVTISKDGMLSINHAKKS